MTAQIPESLHLATATTQKGEKRVGQILDAAVEVLVAGGAEGFSFNKVAVQAGLRLSHLQYYFPDRGALIQAMLHREVARFHEAMRVFADNRKNSAEHRLNEAVNYVLDCNQNVQVNAVVWNVWAMSAHREEVALIQDRWYTEYRAIFRRLVADCNPALERKRLHEVTCLIVSMMEGISVITGSGKPRHPELKDVDGALRATVLRLVYDE